MHREMNIEFLGWCMLMWFAKDISTFWLLDVLNLKTLQIHDFQADAVGLCF